MPSLAPPSSSLFSSVVSQASSVQAVRARLLSSVPSLEVEDADDVETADLRSLSSSSTTTHSHSTCESCAQLETDFAGAVLFVESYQGPHRILTQENSSPKKDFYAYYQQATVGPCPTTSPPSGLSKLELSKWEKWRNLGTMTRQEAMKRYTTALDNLVDDWRRSANLRSAGDPRSSSLGASDASLGRTPSEAGSVTPNNRVRRSTSMFERLPRIYDELGELQDRVEDESKKQEELEAHLLHFTRDNRSMFNQQIEQVEQIRESLVSLVKNLEDEVVQHSAELQRLVQRQQELVGRTENSMLLAVETRVRQVFLIVRGWVQNRTFRAALIVLVGLRVWHFMRRRRLPQFLAQILIRWLAKVSSLDSGNAAPPQLATIASPRR